jgi:nucleoside-diphosphate-sugar epimerase
MSKSPEGPTLVTGAGGFVGANLLERLAARGARVFGVESPSGIDWRTRGMKGVEIVRLDLTREDDVRALVRELRPSAVFNCAAYGAYSVQIDARRIYEVNMLGTRHLLDALREVAGFRAFVQAGSSSEYGFNCSGPSEDAETFPDSDYAVSKIGATSLVRLYARKYGVPAFVLRLYSLYGPYEDFSRLVPTFLWRAREGRLPPLVSPAISRDFVYVDDAASAFDAVVEHAPHLEPGRIFNVGTGLRTTLGEFTALVRALFSVAEEPQWGTMRDRSWDHSGWFADPRRAAAELQWRATTSVRDGLLATMRWIDAHPALVAEGRAKTVVEVRR